MTYAQAYFGGAGAITGAATVFSGGSINAVVGEQKQVTVTCNQDIESLTLEVVIETKAGVDVSTISSGSISNSGTAATFSLDAASTSAERTLNWSIRRADTSEAVATGLLFVTTVAAGD